MVATTLRKGEVAIIGYNTGFATGGDPNGTTTDSLQFVILAPIGSSTVIRFTDRSWNGTSFANAAGDGSFAFTAASDLAAGTVISVTFSGGNANFFINGVAAGSVSAGGFDPEQAGDAIYVYQGTGADSPSTFLHAIEIADGNPAFSASLVNTGLVAGASAVNVNYDSAAYSGPSTDAFAHFYNNGNLFANINDSSNWTGDNHGGQVAHDLVEQNVFNVASDVQLWSAAGGGGGGIVSTNIDSTVSSGTQGYNLVIRYTNDAGDPVQVFANPLDIAFDTAEGKFFIIDSTAGEDGRILQGNISDLIGNPNATAVTTTLLYSSNQPLGSTESQIRDLQIDTVNNIIYFTHGQRLERIVYNNANQVSTVLANFGTGSGNPNGTTNNFIDDFVINFATGTAYLTSHRIVAAQDGDSVTRNYIYKVTNLTGTATFANGQISVLPFSPDDDDSNNGINFAAGEGFPQEQGTLEGIALSPDGNTLYFTAARTLYDHDGDGGFVGDGNAATTDPILTLGGVFSYALVGNPTGTFTALWVPTDDGNDGSQAINETNGPQGLLDDIEVDPITGQLYFLDLTGDQLGITNPPGDEGIWRINANGTGREFIQGIFNNDALGAGSIFLNRAPTVTASTQATPGVTEASNAPASGATALVQPFLTLDVTDVETASNPTQQLNGATVWISNNFQSGATHQDTLTINGTQSGTTAGGIAYSYNAATGAMLLTGTDTFNDYEAAIALVRFNTSGDDPTAYGQATNRTISWAVSDGLNHSDPVSTTVSVTGINDAPVNTMGAAMNFTEDTTGAAGPPAVNAITGISVFDVDADPANQLMTFTFTVSVGTITIRTDVAGGIAAADIVGGANGSATFTLLTTQNEMNATLAATNASSQANGLLYTPPANYNGAATLTLTTNDAGFNGNDPGLTGTGTSEQDQDVKAINIADVNDAPTVGGDGTEDSPTILEDTPFTNATAPTVAALFGGQFSDAIDVQVSGGNPTGSTGDTFAGIAIVADGSAPATGQWEYWTGAAWADIGAASQSAARTFAANTQIRFNPALNYNGAAPTLTVHLIETGGPAITNNGTVNLNPVGTATGGTTVYSTNTVVLSQAITAVNDAPVNTVGGDLTVAEDSGATNVTGMSISDVDANAATDVFTVTLDVLHGTLNLNTGVPSGVTAGNVTGNGTATIVLTGTINQVNTTLAAAGGLTYTPTGNYNGSDRVQITTNDGGATGQDPGLTGTATSEQDQDSKTITVTAVNDPVTGTAPATATLDEDSTNVAITGMSIADIDATLAPSGVYEVTLTSTNGTMTLTTSTGLTFSAGSATASATMTFHGTLADINTALATAKYTPTPNFAGAATITLFVTDTFGAVVATGTGAATNDTDVINVTVNAVNDAPVNSVPLVAQNVNEDNTLVFNSGNGNLITVSDADSALGDLSVTLTVLHGTLLLGGNASLTGETGDGTSSITISGALAAINNALNGLSYTPAQHYNGPDTLTITTNDNGNTGSDPGLSGGANDEQDQDVVSINVAAQNDSPVVALVSAVSSTEQVAGTIDATATVFDVELGGRNDYSGAVLTVGRNGGAAPEDLITFGPSGAFTVDGSNLKAGSDIFATFTGGNGSNLVITFTGSGTPATQARANAVVQSLQYTYTGDSPPASIVLDYSLNDGAPTNAGQGGGGSATGADSITVNITNTPENAAPAVDLDGDGSGTGFASAYTEGGAAAPISDTDVTITDADSGDDIVSATITITNAVTGDKLNVGSLPLSVSVDGSSTDTMVKLVALPGTSAADFEAAIEAVTFSSTSDNPTANGSNVSRSITVVVNDGDSNSPAAIATVTVTDDNDPPTGANVTITAAEDTFRVLGTGDFGFTDDGQLGSVEISAVSGGGIYFDSDGTAGAGTPVLETLPKTYTAQDLIDGKVSFKANPDLNGSGVGSMTVLVTDDDGEDAAATNTVTIDVTAVNDSPVLAPSPNAIAATEQTAVAILPGITVSDVDLDARNGGAGDYAGAQFIIHRGPPTSPQDVFSFAAAANFSVDGSNLKAGGQIFGVIASNANGTLTINFTSLETTATSALADEVIQSIRYTNISDAPPSSVMLVYQFVDGSPGGGQGSGASNVDVEIVTVNIAGVNDAPVNSLGGTIGTGEDAIDAWLSGMSISDPDANPATDDIVVAFNVLNGTLDIRTDVAGGVTAADVVGDDTSTITVTATLNQINATLAASNGLTYSPSLNFNGDDTLTVSTNDQGHNGSDPGLTGDGSSEQDVDTRTISVSPVNDAPVAQPDSVSTPENVVGTGSLFADNGSGADSDVEGDSFTISHVNGSTGNVGATITLASGAKLTVLANGSYSYDPNGKFNSLTDNTSGAVNTSTVGDTFQYTLTGGNTVTVTVTVNGVAGPGDRLMGDGTDNTITGTPNGDLFLLQQGGADTAFGLGSNDVIYFGSAFTSADSVDGGGGTDAVVLQGNYTTTLTNNLTSIEAISLQSGATTEYGDTANNFYDYNIVMNDANAIAGQQLIVNAQSLRAGEDFTFDGSAETDGKYLVFGGRGVDTLKGGNGGDVFVFADGRWGASDSVDGGAGRDAVVITAGNGLTHIAFSATSLINIESVSVSNKYTATPGATPSYEFVLHNGNVAAGQTLIVNGSSLLNPSQTFSVDGSAETNGILNLYGGAGSDVLIGGAQADLLYGGGSADTLTGGAGNDVFRYDKVSESNSAGRDGIQDFTLGDLIDLSRIDANTTVAGDQAFSFIGNAAFSNTAGELRFENVAGPIWLVQGDTDGNGVSDFEVIVVVTDASPIVAGDFIL